MKINFQYIDNDIVLSDNKIMVMEVENKNYFYRIINDLNLISHGYILETVAVYDNEDSEIILSNRMEIYVDYFNIELNSKKNLIFLYKTLKNSINDEDKDNIAKYYTKIKKILSKSLLDSNLSLNINDEYDLENLLKLFKVNIALQNNLLDNLLLIIDINTMFKNNDLLIFVNLKQYLTKIELEELYKYSIYNDVKILLIDSQCYGVTSDLEKKLIIDLNLDEFLI